MLGLATGLFDWVILVVPPGSTKERSVENRIAQSELFSLTFGQLFFNLVNHQSNAAV